MDWWRPSDLTRWGAWLRASSALVLVIAIAPCAPVSAQGVRLDWARGEGAEDCPDRAALEASQRARLGRDPFLPPHDYVVEGAAVREGDDVAVVLRLRSADGEELGARVIRSTGPCAALAPAIELSLSLAIDELVPEPAAAEDDDGPTAVEAPPRVWAALGAPVTFGVVPDPALGVALWGGVDIAPWRVELSLLALPAVGAGQTEPRMAFSWLAGAAAVGLAASPLDWLSLAGTLGIELGSLASVVHGPGGSTPGALPTVAPLLSLSARAHLVPFLAVELGARGTAPLIGHRFVAAGTDRVVFAQEPVALTLWISLVVASEAPIR